MINDGKNIIKTITVLQWAHQIYIKVIKTSLWDGDALKGQACVAVLPRWQARHPQAQAVMSLDKPRHTNLDEII